MLTKDDLKEIKKLFVPLEEDISDVRKELGDVRSDVGTVQSGLTDVQRNLTVVQKSLGEVSKDLSIVHKRVRKIEETTDIMVKVFDEADVKLHQRVTKIEKHLGFPKN